MLKIILALLALFSAARAQAQVYPSPTFQNMTVLGSVTVNGSETVLQNLTVNGTPHLPNASVTASMLASGAASGNLGFAPLARSNFIVADSIDLTGATDASVALQALINANPTKRIYVPAGTPLINNAVTLNNGQTLQCEGRTQTVFQVNSGASGYNLGAANGVIILGTGEPGASVFDCGVSFTQPTSLTRGTVVHYPPALYANNTPRFQIDRVRVSNAWECLTATGNDGGAYIGRLECGALGNTTSSGFGVAFDGSQDTVHINSIECWPYGMNASGVTVYEDQTTVCLSLGRVDGFSADKIATFTSQVIFTSNAGTSGVPYSIADLQLDGDGALLNVGGAAYIQIGNWYTTKSTSSTLTNNAGVFSSGEVDVSNINLQNFGILGSSILVNGGTLRIYGGFILHGAIAQPLASVSSGMLEIANTNDTFPATPVRTQPYFTQSGTGVIILTNNQAVSQASSSPFINVTIDNANNYVDGNNFVGWQHSLPVTNLGFYSMNEYDTLTLTPYFSTQGDFSPSSVVTTGYFQRKGDHVVIDGGVTFNTNAFTTASGTFGLTPNIPAPLSGNSYCAPGVTENVTLPPTAVFPRVSAGPNIYFKYSVSNAGSSLLGNTHILPSKTGVGFSFNCSYRVR